MVRGGYGIFYQGNENHGLSVSNYVNFPFQITTAYTASNAVTPLTPNNSVGTLQNGLLNVPLTAAAGVGFVEYESHPFGGTAECEDLVR